MKIRLLLLSFSVLLLIIFIFFVLSYFNVINFSFSHPLGGFDSVKEGVSAEDPLLLEKASLKKQWDVLAVKEVLLEKKQQEIENQGKILEEKIKETNKQSELIAAQKKEQEKMSAENNSREVALKSLASKVTNVPPIDGAKMLNDLDTSVAVDVIQAIDQIAKQQGKQSTSAYLISLMDPQKRESLMRMLALSPTPIKSLDEETPNKN